MALTRPSPRALGLVGLVAALAFTTTLAGLEWRRADRDASHLRAQLHHSALRQAVAARAVGVATNLFTYDYRNLAATQRYLRSAATGGFAQREAAHDPAVQQQLRQAKAVGSATVKEVTVSDVSAMQATAFVVVMTHVSSTTSGSADGIAYLHLHLRLVGGVWKVDDVQNLSAAS
ncbi:MAG TPA: hypothetical protein VG650_18585 [Mycobacteriales bacterium]|nr:hypothetical protein [Mycobacteriales bacterium]